MALPRAHYSWWRTEGASIVAVLAPALALSPGRSIRRRNIVTTATGMTGMAALLDFRLALFFRPN